jgi:hypothetical protein
MSLRDEVLEPIDWTRDARTQREAALRTVLLKGVERSARVNEESFAYMLLTAYSELRALGVPIETWGARAADHLATDVRAWWTALARDAEAAWDATQARKRERLLAEAMSEIDARGEHA